MTVYATGVRLEEVSRLRVEQIDSERMSTPVEDGKDGHDRYPPPLSHRLLAELRSCWRSERPKTWIFPSKDTGQPFHSAGIRTAMRTLHLVRQQTPGTSPHSSYWTSACPTASSPCPPASLAR